MTAGNKIILLIDDDMDDRELFNEAVLTIDPNIITHYSENGKEAIAMLAELTELPQVIFLDINMPVMDGWKCLSIIKSDERLKDIHVIMYSTSALQHDITKATQLGASWFFMKPNEYEDIKRVLAVIVENMDNDFEGLKNDTLTEHLKPYLTVVN